MGANQSTQNEQEQTPGAAIAEQQWREVVIDDLEEEISDAEEDEPLDSDEEEEFESLLREYELMYTLAVLESERPIQISAGVDDDIRMEAERRTQQTLEAALARAEAKLGGSVGPVNVAPLTMETQAPVAPAVPSTLTSMGTPFKAPLPTSACKTGPRSTGKKRLATLRKRVAELREIQEGGSTAAEGAVGQEEGSNQHTPVRRLNFRAPMSSARKVTVPKMDQTAMQEQMASLTLNDTAPATTASVTDPMDQSEPTPAAATTTTAAAAATPEPQGTPVSTVDTHAPSTCMITTTRSKASDSTTATPARTSTRTASTNKKGEGVSAKATPSAPEGTPSRNTRSAVKKDNKENVDTAAAAGAPTAAKGGKAETAAEHTVRTRRGGRQVANSS